MAKVAITGYSGFIGRHLTDALLKRGNIVYPIGRDFRKVDCDIIYHLACPSTTAAINADPVGIMDTIIDRTREALSICNTALFVNASSMGAANIDTTAQGAYNTAKLCMEVYLQNSGREFLNYRLPSVYGPDMHSDGFIKRCVDGTAYYPALPDRVHYIAHVDDVVEAMADLRTLETETITLGEIYEQFTSGRRGLYRTTSNS